MIPMGASGINSTGMKAVATDGANLAQDPQSQVKSCSTSCRMHDHVWSLVSMWHLDT